MTALYFAIWVLVTLAWHVWVGVLVCRARRTASWLLVLGWPIWALGAVSCAVGRFLDRQLMRAVLGAPCAARGFDGLRCTRKPGHSGGHVDPSGTSWIGGEL
jgi:hypothetical protein